jgi:hypothetical protein
MALTCHVETEELQVSESQGQVLTPDIESQPLV